MKSRTKTSIGILISILLAAAGIAYNAGLGMGLVGLGIIFIALAASARIIIEITAATAKAQALRSSRKFYNGLYIGACIVTLVGCWMTTHNIGPVLCLAGLGVLVYTLLAAASSIIGVPCED